VQDRPFKNYDKYRTRIETFASAIGFSIIRNPNEDSDGSYSPSLKRVSIDPDNTPVYEIAILLHEFGHVIDDMASPDSLRRKVMAAYTVIYDGAPTPAQKALVLACERRAWRCGAALASKLRIPLGKWYPHIQKEMLKGYR
jgi:hypothetical protein